MPFMAHRGSARSCRSPITPVIKKSKTLNDFQNQSFNRELLDDQFKLNLENINQNDVVQLQIVLGSRNKNYAQTISSSHSFEENTYEEDDFEKRIVAVCNLQILWMIHNKSVSHWVKFQKIGSNQTVGKVKIKNSFFKNKTFSDKKTSASRNCENKIFSLNSKKSGFAERSP